MTVLEKERTEARPEAPAPTPTPPKGRRSRLPWILAALAVAAVGIAAIAFWASSDEGSTEPVEAAAPATTVAAATPASQGPGLYTADELILMELVNEGYIPPDAVDWDRVNTIEAIKDGFVPVEALSKAIPPVPSLFSDSERETMRLVNLGMLPAEAIDQELLEMKQLVNQGFIPRQASEPAP